MSKLEAIANLLNLAAVYLARKNHVLTWPVGIIACALFAVLFYEVKLYADVVLQGFFIVTGAIGLWNWKFGSPEKTDLPITRSQRKTLVLQFVLSAVLTGLYGSFLHLHTDASFPFVDSVVLMFSVWGQLLMMARKVENWLVWIIVNVIAVPLYASKNLYLTSAVYFGFLLIAIWGWFTWRKMMVRDHSAEPGQR
jgi:nicotinamide mononucleotide transporter